MSKRLRVAVSLGCAVCAALVCLLCVNAVRADAERERSETLKRYGGETVSLVVAARALEAGETVTTSDVSARDWISSLAPEGALLTLDEVVGRKVSVPVAANAPVCELNFRDVTAMAQIPSGQVAVSVPITEKLGITPSVVVGSHVVAYRATETTAQLMGGLATVLAVPAGSGNGFSQGSITIAVPAADVPAILSASATGDLRLVVPADDVTEFSGAQEGVRDVAPQNTSASAADAAGKAADKAVDKAADKTVEASNASAEGSQGEQSSAREGD